MTQFEGFPSRSLLGLMIVAAICHLSFAELMPKADSCLIKMGGNTATKQACSGRQMCYIAKFTTQRNTYGFDIQQGCVSHGDPILTNARIQTSKYDECSHVAAVGIRDKSPFSAMCICNTNDCNTQVRRYYTSFILVGHLGSISTASSKILSQNYSVNVLSGNIG